MRRLKCGADKTAVSTTIDQQRINNLPINERNYLAFALTTSTSDATTAVRSDQRPRRV
jgi:hypothetical protein